jgi:hypothetical protein
MPGRFIAFAAFAASAAGPMAAALPARLIAVLLNPKNANVELERHQTQILLIAVLRTRYARFEFALQDLQPGRTSFHD